MSNSDAEISSVVNDAKDLFASKKYGLAIEIFRSALKFYETHSDPLHAAEMKNNISVCLNLEGKAQEALQAAQGTDLIFEQAGDKHRQALALGNQASALEDLKQLGEALELYEKSNELLKQIGEKEYRAIILKRISTLQLKHGRKLESLASMNAALQVEPTPTGKERSIKNILNKFFSFIHPKP